MVLFHLGRVPSDAFGHRRMDYCHEVLHPCGAARRSPEIRRQEDHRRYEFPLHSALDSAHVGSVFWLDHLWSVLSCARACNANKNRTQSLSHYTLSNEQFNHQRLDSVSV